ncbi:hypothetical protein SAMN05660473_01745 [Arthrobacter sp. 49Tsu3.1M3]|uniref:hypothetical protein n=1 Tax=Arthrobacter sp. 49Tsu3.1M3 TaxID=1279029 RepID=UPI0009CD6621|nr:hypothetical protein [Arthrobacter sp. 49Tsu3.1M3]SKB64888.1 hypothetical protein SAMN05660473_01745 [Arthrobacter sp. 49Tsu3.1M3]
MSGQHPGAGSGPAPEPAPVPAPTPVTGAPAAPAPETTPRTAWQHDAGCTDAGNADAVRPEAGAAAGWVAPPVWTVPASEPAWGMPRQEPVPAAATGWGAPGTSAKTASPAKPWTLKRGLTVAGAAAVLAVGAGAGVYALTSSATAASGAAGGAAAGGPGGQGVAPGMPGSGQDGSAQGGFAGGGMPGQGGPGDFAAGGMGSGLSAAVHAEYVVLQGSAYTTMAEQLGTVSEVSSSSVTVKSSDGFTRSYALGSDVVVSNLQQRRQQAGGTGTQLSVADIVAGGTVRIVAAKDGSGYTAASVMVVAATATGQTN